MSGIPLWSPQVHLSSISSASPDSSSSNKSTYAQERPNYVCFFPPASHVNIYIYIVKKNKKKKRMANQQTKGTWEEHVNHISWENVSCKNQRMKPLKFHEASKRAKKTPAWFIGDDVTKRVAGSGSESPSPAWSSGSGSSFHSGLISFFPLSFFSFLFFSFPGGTRSGLEWRLWGVTLRGAWKRWWPLLAWYSKQLWHLPADRGNKRKTSLPYDQMIST